MMAAGCNSDSLNLHTWSMLRNGWGGMGCTQFVVKSRIQGKVFKAHTGGIDSVWPVLKASIPKSVSMRVKGTFNNRVGVNLVFITSWQWRCAKLGDKTDMAFLQMHQG